MATWIFVAICVIMVVWGVIEILSFLQYMEAAKLNKLRVALGYKPVKYTNIGALVTILYLLLLVFFVSYLIFG